MVALQKYLSLGSLPYTTLALGTTANANDVLQYVDPLIGSNNGGNVFAGASLPYAMAKAVADVDGQNTGGFATDGSRVTGFSALHDSGTGGNPSLGNFPLFPQYCPDDDINNCLFPKAARAVHYVNNSVVARPGYFALQLENGIHTEMTSSMHAALYHFTFPPRTASDDASLTPLFLLDLTDLWNSRQNASVEIDPDTGRITADGTFLPSFGAGSYRSYVCVDFPGVSPYDSGIWVNDRAGTEQQTIFVTRGFNNFYLQAGGFVRVPRPEDGTVTVRVGVSYISTEQACTNAESEISRPLEEFDSLRRAAEDAWREKLSPISVRPRVTSTDTTAGNEEALLRSFWSGIYRTMLDPQDLTGENPLWTSTEPYFDSFYCIWDSFRAQHPLLTLIDPIAQSRMVRSLLDTYKHEGWLPDCRMSLCKGWTQGGSNADVVLADAFVKKLPGIDWGLAYEAMVNDAENEPLEWSKEGRGGLNSWKRLGYIPYRDFDYLGFGTNSRSISRTLEYAYDDYCIATVARGLGHQDDAEKYLNRSGNWRNVFKDDQVSMIDGTDTGFVGFFQPRNLNGSWAYQDPIACSPLTSWCSLTSNPSETFESSIWEYQFYVPHDMAPLITLLSGPDTFNKRLDFFHTSGLADPGNEPVFLTVFQYHYTGRPGLSSHRVRSYIPARFNDTHAGLPGNDDSGAMGAFMVFAMMGLFPVPGQDVYLIVSPFFEEVCVDYSGSLVSATSGGNGNGTEAKGNGQACVRVSGEGDYIQSATLDGEVYTRNWIGHDFFVSGRLLELVLGEEESDWGTGEKDIPPSIGDVDEWLKSTA